MSDEVRIWSATTLIKEALGTSRAIAESNKTKMAGIAYDRYKTLGNFVEEGDRDAAVKWLSGRLWDEQEKAMARGTEIHKIAEKIVLGQEDVKVEPGVEKYVEQFLKFLEDWRPKVLLSESPVYNLTRRYAGTLDSIMEIEGEPLVVDMKSTPHGPDAKNDSGKPRARPPFSEVSLQLTMYRRAELVGLIADRREVYYKRYYAYDPEKHSEPMPETAGGACLVISPEDYMLVPIDTGPEVWRYVLHMIEMADWQIHASKRVIGTPATPRTREPV